MPWTKIDGACQHMGGISRKAAYAMIPKGLKVVRVGHGRNILFRTEWCDEFLERTAAEKTPEPVQR